MAQLKLHFFPGTCSRVSLIALEECGVPFDTQLVKFPTADHRSSDYLRLNPQGKVPTLTVDGVPLTENIAIVTWLARKHPAARLMPFDGDALHEAQALADFSWLSSGIHPIVTRIVIPQLFCDTPDGARRVVELAGQMMSWHLAIAERRLASSDWLLGDWSAVDGYLFWVWGQITSAGFDGSAFPGIAAHAQRMLSRPAVQRALRHEQQAGQQLAALGLPAGPPPRMAPTG